MSVFEYMLSLKSIGVFGTRRSGKTSFVYKYSEFAKSKGKEVWVYGNPNPKSIKKLGFKVLYNLENLEKLKNCIVWIDEPQIVLPTSNKKSNESLKKILSISGQKKIQFIFSTCDTGWLTRSLESYIDCYIIKDVDYDSIKRGSKIKKVINKNCLFFPESVCLKPNEYFFDSRKSEGLNGRHTFKVASFWSEELSNPFNQ